MGGVEWNCPTIRMYLTARSFVFRNSRVSPGKKGKEAAKEWHGLPVVQDIQDMRHAYTHTPYFCLLLISSARYTRRQKSHGVAPRSPSSLVSVTEYVHIRAVSRQTLSTPSIDPRINSAIHVHVAGLRAATAFGPSSHTKWAQGNISATVAPERRLCTSTAELSIADKKSIRQIISPQRPGCASTSTTTRAQLPPPSQEGSPPRIIVDLGKRWTFKPIRRLALS